MFIWNYGFSEFVSTHHISALPLTPGFYLLPAPRAACSPHILLGLFLLLEFQHTLLHCAPPPALSTSWYPKTCRTSDNWVKRGFLSVIKKDILRASQLGGDLPCQKKALVSRKERADGGGGGRVGKGGGMGVSGGGLGAELRHLPGVRRDQLGTEREKWRKAAMEDPVGRLRTGAGTAAGLYWCFPRWVLVKVPSTFLHSAHSYPSAQVLFLL